MSRDSKVTVVLADDHPEVLEEVTRVLGSKFHILATASNGALAVQAVAKHEPDVAVLDISMPVMSGIEAAREIRRMRLRTKVVFLSVFSDPDIIEVTKTMGAGYVWKVHMSSGLTAAIMKASLFPTLSTRRAKVIPFIRT